MLRVRCSFRLKNPFNGPSNFPYKRWVQLFSKRKLRHAAHVMGPTLAALVFTGISSSVAHAQGTMDFSGATTLMSTFKTFAMYARGCHLPWRAYFCGNPHDERAISRRYPRTFRRIVWCRSARLGSRLDRQPDRAVDVGGDIDMAKRGEPLPINQALNRPRAKFGLDLSAWMAIVFVCVTVFLVGFRLLAMVAFPTLAVSAWLTVRKHPKMFQLWGLSLRHKSYYDPRKY